jgi:hypothetical protein
MPALGRSRERNCRSRVETCYAVFFPALTRAHRALCAAAIFLRAAAESVRLSRIGTTFAVSRTFAQRALWAAAILARADADNFRVPVPLPYVLPNAASAAPIPRSSLANRSCSFFNRRTTPDKLDIEFPLVRHCNSAGVTAAVDSLAAKLTWRWPLPRLRRGKFVVVAVQSAQLVERGMLPSDREFSLCSEIGKFARSQLPWRSPSRMPRLSVRADAARIRGTGKRWPSWSASGWCDHSH